MNMHVQRVAFLNEKKLPTKETEGKGQIISLQFQHKLKISLQILKKCLFKAEICFLVIEDYIFF